MNLFHARRETEEDSCQWRVVLLRMVVHYRAAFPYVAFQFAASTHPYTR